MQTSTYPADVTRRGEGAACSMIRIRFHGRGGQGAKTAARIVGTAAFLEGFNAQDSPIYGAERRGAPVAAFTRLARGPILERGVITHPDLVVVADETLLGDPAARVLDGLTEDTAIFVNSPRAPERLQRMRSIPGRAVTLDLTGLMLARLETLVALSAPLGAVAARLAGLNADHLREAVIQELSSLGLSEPVVGDNVALALECFEAVSLVPVKASPAQIAPAAFLWTPVYQPPGRGSPRIAAAANAPLRKTGAWRIFRPVLNEEKCNGCTLCFVYCPDAAIALTDRNLPVIDYDHCKGCGLCIVECPTQALTAVRESVVEEHHD